MAQFSVARMAGALLIACVVSSCAPSRVFVGNLNRGWESLAPPDSTSIEYRVYLIGDAGAGNGNVLALLERMLSQEGKEAAVVFLGDNIYPDGLPDSADAGRAEAERLIRRQVEAVRDFRGRIVFLPGNHDWGGGLAAVRRQERFVEEALGRGNAWLPDDGYPGPVEVDLTKDLKLIALDTQWWFSEKERPFGDTGEYELDQPVDFFVELQDLIDRQMDEDLLFVGHHPLFSAGEHAGYKPFKNHLFPLERLVPHLYLPLPLVGSLYPLYVRFFGGAQNLADPRFRAFREAMIGVLEEHADLNMVYASGHEHSLQLFTRAKGKHYVISGAGAEARHVSGAAGANFAAQRTGFVRLDYATNGEIWMSAWSPETPARDGLLFRAQLRGPLPDRVPPVADLPDEPPVYADSMVTTAANPSYQAGALKRFFLGAHNRRAWALPVTAPVLDIGTRYGGLTPMKRGGGMQTLSLRLEDPNGHEFVLRSIDKDPSKTVPENLQGTLATDLVQDQIAAIHPYGAFIIPRLARAAGVFHTNPELVFLPDDPRLGHYREAFGNQLMMLEDRPDDDMSHEPSYGGATKVIGANDLYAAVNDDNDHRVDQKAFVRVRLFDMLLSDWDRHRDQWRWSATEPEDGEGKIYLPIPRDRDWAFNRMNGLLMTIYKQIDPRFQSFNEDYGYLRGFTINGGEQDRRFTNELTRAQWIEQARSIQEAITDEVIQEAIEGWPKAVVDLDGERIATTLRARRDKLVAVAERMYEMNADVVDVVGSNKHERFEVERLPDGRTVVSVFKTSKEGELRRLLYSRTLLPGETRELRLYGQDGNDAFIVRGRTPRGVRVIAVGGGGEDRFDDSSFVQGASKQTLFYDSDEGNEWLVGPETRVIRSSDPRVNAYDPDGYAPDTRLPKSYLDVNREDGLFLGGGMQFIHHGFRKSPFATSHTLRANVATRTGAVNVRYDGMWIAEEGAWDVGLEAGYLSPDNIKNYFGLGNDTPAPQREAAYYEARLSQVRVAPFLQRRIEPGLDLRVGPKLEWTRIRDDDNRSIGEIPIGPGVSERWFDDQLFTGLQAEVRAATIDSGVFPRRGLVWWTLGEVNIPLIESSDRHLRLESEFSFYLTATRLPAATMAVRLGAGHVFGTFPFFYAHTLGQKSNLRGYSSSRYAGRSNLYQNLELRVKLVNFSSYAAVGKAGVLGFVDNGRVWTDGEFSTTWHHGAGGGIWASFFDAFVLAGWVGASREDRLASVRLGFLF